MENGLLAVQEREGGNLDVAIVRPGGVLAKGTMLPAFLFSVTLSIRVDELAAAMVYEAMQDVMMTRTLECGALRSRGRWLLWNNGRSKA